MLIYQATNTLSQSHNQLQKNNILTFLFLAHGKCSNSHLLMLEIWGDAGDSFTK